MAAQDPTWLSDTLIYVVPVVSAVAAIFAAIFAGLALRYIGRQIRIANDQTEIANKSLLLTSESLGLTRESVDIARQDIDATMKSLALNEQSLSVTLEQARKYDEERSAAPLLSLAIDTFNTKEFAMRADTRVELEFRILNAGRAAEDAHVSVAFPEDWMTDVEWEQLDQAKPGPIYLHVPPSIGLKGALDKKKLNLGDAQSVPELAGEMHRVIETRLGERVIANVPTLAFWVPVVAPSGRYELYWKIVTEQWSFPKKGAFGTITVYVDEPQS